MADTSLNLSAFDLPPRRTMSLATVQLHPTGFAGFFEPWVGPSFSTEDVAECPFAEDHDAPGADCDCGFRAADDPESLLDLINPSLEELAGAAILDVELGGFVLPMGPGFRGSSQRVLSAGLLRWCGPCLRGDLSPAAPPQLFAVERGGWLQVLGLCEDHAAMAWHPIALTPAEVAEHLRAPVGWADPIMAEAVRVHLERRWALPQLVGPLAERRAVGSLRMGQLGFVAPDAVRLDGRGALWVDRGAPAPQRPAGAAFLPIRRMLDLRIELLALTPEAQRVDARLARWRPPLLGAAEEVIVAIRGLRHMPRLAAAIAR